MKGVSLKERSGKLERLTEMLDEIRENDERTLIFTQYVEMGDLLQNYLDNLKNFASQKDIYV